eukprot:3871118-Alexandrium_andersonii.AAC.1
MQANNSSRHKLTRQQSVWADQCQNSACSWTARSPCEEMTKNSVFHCNGGAALAPAHGHPALNDSPGSPAGG